MPLMVSKSRIEMNMKIVLLCQYWSEESKIMLGDKHYVRELSPWIQEILNSFKNKNDVELHVVAPNYASNEDKEISVDGISFHFFKYSHPLLVALFAPLVKLRLHHPEPYKIAERISNVLTNYRYPMRRIADIINNIRPDIIHLYGSENPDYSVGVIPLLNSYPILLTVQGYAYMFPDKDGNWLVRRNASLRIKYEDIINKGIRYLTTIGLENNAFDRFNNGQQLFNVCEITNIPGVDASVVEKKYDIIFYSRVNKEKGIEDLIEAVSLLHKGGKEYKTLVIGRLEHTYRNHLVEMIKSLGIAHLFELKGFVDSHQEVYNLAASSRVLVLPTHFDCQPNSIREAMFMKLPVVATNVGGIPSLNVHKECLSMVPKQNVPLLASAIARVLEDGEYANELVKNGYSEMFEYYSPDQVYQQFINAYKEILELEKTR